VIRRRATWLTVGAAAVLLAVSFYVVQRWLEQGQLSDVGVYQNYASYVRAGQMPYRDFAFEYPPAALPVFLLPAWMSWSYATSFAILMGVCGAGCLALVAATLRAVDASAARESGALFLFAVSPLVLGSLFDTRFDLWPALLALGGIAALVREKPLLSGGLLGLGFAAKLWPGVLLPVAAIHLWRRRGSGAAVGAVTAFVVVAAACFIPFAVLAPSGLRASLSGQLDRPLQVESLGSAVLMAAQHLGMRPLETVTSHGAQALSGRGAALAAFLSTAALIASVLGIWFAYAARRTREREAALLAAAAVIVAVVAFDKVLSPQYLIWIVPFVVLAGGTRGFVAAGLLLVALGLTQTWFPWNYWNLALDHASPWSWFLLARDLSLVALAAVLAGLQPRIRLRRRKSTFAGRSASLRMR
jgi:glycosyl transferase family 87